MSPERAKELAWQWWTTTERQILQDKPLREEKFSVIADSYLKDIEPKTRILNEQNRPLVPLKKYARHEQSIRLHLTSFFGSMPIRSIQPDDVERWLEQRLSSRPQKTRGGRDVQDENAKAERWSPPARSTVQKDAVAFAAVVRHARLRFKVDTKFVPELPLPPKSEDTRRPRFYPEEWQRISQTLYARMNTRSGQSGRLSENSIWFRSMLFFFVMTLHGTGLRVAEAMRLKVKHLRRIPQNAIRRDTFLERLRSNAPHGKHVLSQEQENKACQFITPFHDYRVVVDSDNQLKHYTHQRIVIPSLNIAPLFEELLHSLMWNLPEAFIGDIRDPKDLNPELWLFCHRDGRRIKSFDHGFNKVLKRLGLSHYDGKKRSLTSIRHTYASEKIEARAADLKSIADNMGTTIEILYKHYAQELRELRAADLQVV